MKTTSLTSTVAGNILLAGALALATPVFAAAPTVHEVYVAAEAGNFTQAQALMDQVLKEHPNSATAHFVEAELLAKQGKLEAAKASLATAERLSPGLPKVNPTALTKLRAVLAGGATTPAPATNYEQKRAAAKPAYNDGAYNNGGSSGGGGLPWGSMLLMGALVIGGIWLVKKFMAGRQQQGGPLGNAGNQGFNPGGAAPGYPPGNGPYPQQGYPQPGYGQPQQGSGLGSRVMGGLATGAAVGAGFVAAEAIARQFTGGHNSDSNSGDHARNDIVYDDPARSNDMGGNDFGVSGGWDDASGGGGGDAGGDEWN